MMLPPDVQGVTMISSPGSGLIAPMQVCIAAVPEVTVTTWATPWRAANSRSNCATFGPFPSAPELITSESASISSSPK